MAESKSKEKVVLSVHNEGAIPSNAIATIFEPLTRGEDENLHKTTSLGLGLFIAREIVAAHGGELDVNIE